ncbi:MAG TPA: hypothetical protein VMS88_02470 [Terriglobales bacterium]|nr:hypothetical protein [Terriglobales bacterium]
MRWCSAAAFLLVLCTLPAAAWAEAAAPAEGFLFQVRMPVTSISSLLNSAVGVPQFTVGIRRGRVAYGLGLGLSQAGTSENSSSTIYRHEYKLNATLFQVAPTLWYGFWRSADGTTTGDLAISGQYGRVSFKSESSGFDGIANYDYVTKGSGNLFGFLVGVGGDHHLSANFALGAEIGAQGTFASDVKSDQEFSPKEGFSSSLLYGALRATVTF